uniref:Putative dehydrogenase with different specificities related to short-chain alcohol dehydrogenase n=1 Tax=Corethrella appendiculata TaxID=1370023 RepID=U5EY50_9DIPT
MDKKLNESWNIAGIVVFSIIGIVIVIYFTRKYFQGGYFRKCARADAKTVIITGVNSCIGKRLATEMAQRGATVYITCKDEEEMERVKQRILDRSGSQNVFGIQLDLSSFDSIRKFAKKFLESEKRLHILINNENVVMVPKQLTKDGFESHLGINHLGPFLLTNLLLNILMKTTAPSRIVNITSLSYKWAILNKDDLNSENFYHKWKAYGQSKLCNILFTRHLARKIKDKNVTTYVVNPGIVASEFENYFRSYFNSYIYSFLVFLAKPFLWLFLKSDESASQSVLFAALDPALKTENGKFYSDCKEVELMEHARSIETAEWLWKTSEKLTGLRKSA